MPRTTTIYFDAKATPITVSRVISLRSSSSGTLRTHRQHNVDDLPNRVLEYQIEVRPGQEVKTR